MFEVLMMAGQLVVAAVGGLIAAGIWIAVGGLGAISNLKKRTEVLEDELTRVDNRLSRDQKTRSADRAVAARTEARSIKDVARDFLSDNDTPTVVRMPGRAKPKRN